MTATDENRPERIVAIVPALDCADTIGDTVAALGAVDAIDRVLVVDDGSGDDTAAAAQAAGADVLVLPVNRGKGGAVAAGVAVSRDATIFVFIDADLARTAGAATVLIDPVVRGDADMTVGTLPPAAGRGGFGAIKNLSARGVQAACGLELRAPLSGQRAVRAEFVRDGLPAAGRFGLEVALNIDVARAGGRVLEVDVPMDHRHTGRSLAGFVHRGRQGLDIVAALWPRVVPAKRRIAAVGVLTVLICAGSIVLGGRNVPVTRPLGATPSKVVVFGMQPFGFDDLDRGMTPNLQRLLDRGSIAAMSVRAVSRYPTSTQGYLSISAGARLTAGAKAGNVLDADASLGPMSAAQYVGSLAGVRPRGDLVAVDGPSLARSNDNAESAGSPGTLADLLGEHGHASAAVTNNDRPALLDSDAVIDRAAALAAMNSTFGIDHGTVDSDDLLRPDVAAPYGVRADTDEFAARTKAALATSDFVVVDPGDLSRAQSFASRATPDAQAGIQDAALRNSDELLGRIVDVAGPDALILVVSVRPPRSQFRLTPLIMAGPGVPRGVVTSPSTQRTGLAAITDIAPTILAAFGITVPDDLPGNALRYEAGSHQLDLLKTYDRDTLVKERTYVPTSWFYIWIQAVVYALVLFVVARRPRFLWLRRWLRPALLCLAAIPAASLAVRAIPGLTRWFVAAQGIATGILALVLGLFVSSRRRHALSPLSWLCGITLVIIVVDIWTGTNLEASSWLGYSFHSAGRFYGVPNTTFAVLGACSLIWAGIVVQYTEFRDEALWWIGCVFAVVLVSAGAPMLGADVGTLITLGPIFALAWWVLSGRTIRIRALVLAAVGMAALVAAAAGLDLMRPPADRSHLGRFASELFADGPSVLTGTFLRKQSANFRIMAGTIWTRLVPIVAIFWFVPLVWERRNTEVFGRRRALRVTAWFVVAAALLGFASNDSGPVVVALFVAWLLPLLALLLLDATHGAPVLQRADGTSVDDLDLDFSLDPIGYDEPVTGDGPNGDGTRGDAVRAEVTA